MNANTQQPTTANPNRYFHWTYADNPLHEVLLEFSAHANWLNVTQFTMGCCFYRLLFPFLLLTRISWRKLCLRYLVSHLFLLIELPFLDDLVFGSLFFSMLFNQVSFNDCHLLVGGELRRTLWPWCVLGRDVYLQRSVNDPSARFKDISFRKWFSHLLVIPCESSQISQ